MQRGTLGLLFCLHVVMVRKCFCCGTSYASGLSQEFCPSCSTKRGERVDKRFSNRGRFESKGMPCEAKKLAPKLAGTFDSRDCCGKVWCLGVRPDIGGLKRVSKGLLDTNKSVLDRLLWVLCCHRLFDQIDNVKLVLPYAKKHMFNRRSLAGLEQALLESDEKRAGMKYGSEMKAGVFAKVRTNPTGCAAAHSGRAWLKTMLEDSDAFNRFKQGAKAMVVELQKKRNAAQQMALHKAIVKARFPHTSEYYEMQVFRVAKHCFDVADRGSNARHPPCASTEHLWNEVLLAKDKGAEAGAIHFGLRSVSVAAKFVRAMQKSHPDFDMCSLACWLCLAKPKKQRKEGMEEQEWSRDAVALHSSRLLERQEDVGAFVCETSCCACGRGGEKRGRSGCPMSMWRNKRCGQVISQQYYNPGGSGQHRPRCRVGREMHCPRRVCEKRVKSWH